MTRTALGLFATVFTQLAFAACDQTLTMQVTFDGAKAAESRIVYLRAANKAGIELVKAGEDEGKKGHKKAWGNT